MECTPILANETKKTSVGGSSGKGTALLILLYNVSGWDASSAAAKLGQGESSFTMKQMRENHRAENWKENEF